ncbi:hypothetical protein FPQ18DRAFT_336304 [Pyronema domesticum]|nr:hypothetical protein FPQ18DRAFT_336304 [Pyronema domesticum]
MSERIKTRESRLAALNEAFARNPAEPWLAYFGRIRDMYPRAEQWVIDINIKGAIDCYSRLFPISYLEPSIPREHSLAESTAHSERAFSGALSVTSEAVTMADNTRGYFFPSAPTVDPTIGCFICPVCKKWQMVREWMNKDEVDSAWMKHICADIEPYMCLNETCAQHARSFKRLRDLMEHHRIEHGGTRPPPDCPFGCPDDGGFPDDIDWYKHVGHHMRDVRLMVLPTSLYESRKYDDTTFDSESVNSSSLGVSHVSILHIDEMQEDPSKAEDSKLNAEKSKQNFAAQQNRPGSSILTTTTVTSHDERNLPAHLNLNN